MMSRKEDNHQQLRALAARAVTDSLRAAASRSSAADRAARFRDCVRSLEAEKAKMEVFHRELPISVHLVADVIEWLKEELAQHRRQRPHDLFAPAAEAAAAAKDGAAVKAEDEADANDKRSWMSSAQLWSCGSHDDSTANTNGVAAAHNKVSTAFKPTLASVPTLARSSDDAAGKPGAMPVPDLSLSSPPSAAAAPSATSSAVTGAAGRQHQHQQAQAQQQRKARRCWSPELHRRFVAALQRLGGAQVATPKQIGELMKVDGLTNDEVKSHLQKYRLHTRRTSSDVGGVDQHVAAAAGGLWSSAPEQQYATSQHSTSQSQSGSPQGPLQLTVSSRAMSATAGDSCDGGDEAEGGGRSESYGWEMQVQQPHGTKASSS
ncbi:transcription factor HHO3-like isoform X2 [Miscanthus floridulus]|uniref:transcription factor HHO3-like isoform X2 n=1 Tax=Miscanthus floridulus TaxID=154761 RepID=UPI003458ABBB